jgi:YfiH family protein
VLLRSAAFDVTGVVHGFTTRHGGVSVGTFDSLNVSAKRGDTVTNVEENLRRICAAGGFERRRLARVRQVHGASVLSSDDLTEASEGDAIWVRRGDPLVASVTTADCVPVLLVDADAGVAAAIHSGWRGTVAGISARAVETLLDAGASLAGLSAAIGPCIELDAFEVGNEVAEQFEARHVRREGYEKPHVDLVACVTDQLHRSGVAKVERVGGCTHANPDRYFSYRRDGAMTGQALSFVGFV